MKCSAKAAAQSVLIYSAVAYLFLRLNFGGAPNPPTWCAFSEILTDLSNEIAQDPDWDPRLTRSPDVGLSQRPRYLTDDVPMALGRELFVNIPTQVSEKSDCFIDDIIWTFLDGPDNHLERNTQVVPLAIHTTMRPHAGNGHEPLPRRKQLSEGKLKAEGTPAEVQIVLGWGINTRTLQLFLPTDKYTAWSGDLSATIQTGKTTMDKLDSLIGGLTHASLVVPLPRHFLGRIRARIVRTQGWNKLPVRLSKSEVANLKLWEQFMRSAHQGISLNRIALRKPSRLMASDSGPSKLGGLLWSGRAWRLQFPPTSPLYGQDNSNNLLEFLGMKITVLLQLDELEHEGSTEECLLALGDNTSAISWLFKTSKLPADSIYTDAVSFIFRHLALTVTNSSHCLFSNTLQERKTSSPTSYPSRGI